MRKSPEERLRIANAKIRELEEQLGNQAIQLSRLGKASFEVRAEDSENLAEFKATNKSLIEFVEKIAKTKSKFAKEARDLLGYE